MLGEGSTSLFSGPSGQHLREPLPIKAGTLVMDGSWRFRWLDDVNFELVFRPDDRSSLPHWSAGPVAIAFENAHEMLAALMTREARLGLRQRLQLQVFGRARITADHLAVAMDDDGHPYCWMRCLDIEPAQTAQPAQSLGA